MSASREEIHRWLRACQNEPWYRQQLGLTWKGLAEAIGISGFSLRAARSGATVRKDRGEGGGYVPGVTVEMLAKIERVMLMIEGGKMVFKGGKAIDLTTYARVAPAQPIIVDDGEWNFWAPCRGCGGRKWVPLWTNRTPVVGCLRCNPSDGWYYWGARGRDSRLIDRVLASLPVSDETDGVHSPNLELPKPPVRRGVRQRRAESSVS